MNCLPRLHAGVVLHLGTAGNCIVIHPTPVAVSRRPFCSSCLQPGACTVHTLVGTRPVRIQPQSSQPSHRPSERICIVPTVKVKGPNAVARGGCAEHLRVLLSNGPCNDDTQAKSFEVLEGHVRTTMLKFSWQEPRVGQAEYS